MKNIDRKIIDRIKKLLSLGKSSNEHEAALASTRARELLTEYNIELSEVILDSKEKEFLEVEESEIEVKRGRWYSFLAGDVAHLFDCRYFRMSSYRRNPYKKSPYRIVFIGTKVDVEIATYTFTFLRKEVTRFTDGNCVDKRNKNSYRLGILSRIHERISEEKSRIKANEKQCTSLVICKDDLIKKHLEKAHPDIRKERLDAPSVDPTEYARGYKDGKRVRLHRGIEESK